MARRHAKKQAVRRASGGTCRRTEGVDKVTGRARYIDDLVFPDMIFGPRSLHDRARAHRRRRCDPGFDWSWLHHRRPPRHRSAGTQTSSP